MQFLLSQLANCHVLCSCNFCLKYALLEKFGSSIDGNTERYSCSLRWLRLANVTEAFTPSVADSSLARNLLVSVGSSIVDSFTAPSVRSSSSFPFNSNSILMPQDLLDYYGAILRFLLTHDLLSRCGCTVGLHE